MKGNKKILIVAILLLLIAVGYSTYAIYKSEATGSGSVNAAAWVVKVNDTDIVENNVFTLGNISWASPEVGKAGTIAPGDHGTVTITIDASGSQVDVDYEISINTASVENENFSVAAASGSQLTGTIPYATGANAMQETVTLDIIWNGIDTASANAADIDLAGDEISIPITVTAKQRPSTFS